MYSLSCFGPRIFQFLTAILLITLPLTANAENGAIAPLPSVNVDLAGSIVGDFEVNDLGSATYSIKIPVPPGTNGLAPELSLVYNSTAGESFIGQRWSLNGLSQISRCAPTIAQDGLGGPVSFTANDKLCLDGKRLVALNGMPGAGAVYGLEIEDFTKVVQNGSMLGGAESFTAHTRNGLIYEYGLTPNARLVGINHTAPLAWLLSRVSDRLGNSFEISYQNDPAGGETVPLRIDYTRNIGTGLAPYNSVRFEYEPLTIPESRYLKGGKFLTSQRMKRLAIYTEEALAWEYKLSYRHDSIVKVDQLIQIEECGGNGVCIPPTTFRWSSNTSRVLEPMSNLGSRGPRDYNGQLVLSGDWNGDGKQDPGFVSRGSPQILISQLVGFLNFPTGPYQGIDSYLQNEHYDPTQSPILTGDWNGDGRTDLMHYYDDDHEIVKTFLSAGNGFIPGPTIAHGLLRANPLGIYGSDRFFVGDWNGDGRTDVGRMHGTEAIFYISQGSNFIPYAIVPLTPPNPYPFNVDSEFPVLIGDWNGDGMSDFGRMIMENDHRIFRTFMSTGTGFEILNDQIFTEQYWLGNSPKLVGDFNGDGLTDIGRVDEHGTHICYSTGISFENCRSGFGLSTLSYYPAEGEILQPVIIGDFNGDGTSDIARVGNNQMRVWFFKGDTIEGPVIVADNVPELNSMPLTETNGRDINGWGVADLDGDGRQDLFKLQSESGDPNHLYSLFLRQPGVMPNMIDTITNGFGGRVDITYKSLADAAHYTKGTSAVYPQADLQGPLYVVTNVRAANGIGGTFDEEYKYQGLKSDLNGRGISGFERIERYNLSQQRYSRTSYLQEYPFRAFSYLKEDFLANGTLIGRESTTWASAVLSNQRVLPYVANVVVQSFEPNDGALYRQVSTHTQIDGFGNPLRIEKTKSDGTSETTINTYDNDAEQWIIGKLRTSAITKTSSTIGGNAGTVTRTAAFEYNSRGLLRSETIEPDSVAQSYTKDYEFDLYGNIVRQTHRALDLPARVEITEYDARGRFPIRKTNALGQATRMQYDPRFGKIIWAQDPNGLIAQSEFDAFGRPFHETSPDGTEQRTLFIKSLRGFTAGPAAYFTRIDRSGLPPVLTWYDSLSREIAKELIDFHGRTITVEKQYDAVGRNFRVSQPYDPNAGTPSSEIWTTYNYDNAGRIIRTTEPGSRVTLQAYDGLSTTVTDPKGHTMTRTIDLDNRVLAITDALGGTLTYAYDGAGNPVQITDPQSNVTRITYDRRGNKTSISDPSTGTSYFTYNGFSQPTSTTDANKKRQQYQYDLLGRLVQKTGPEGSQSWVYDTAPHGIGRLAQVNGLAGYKEYYTYDSLGRTIETRKEIGGVIFNSTNAYDQYSRVREQTYPSGFSTLNEYDQRGFLAAVKRGDTGALLWQPLATNLRGQLLQEAFGNGLTTTRTYFPETGLISGIKTDPVQHLAFVFDQVGNLIERDDLKANLSESFQYDPLNRLTASRVGNGTINQVAYDAVGNIINRSDVGTYYYGGAGAGPFALTKIDGQQPNDYKYDAAGNRLTSRSGSVVYNSVGIPIAIKEGKIEMQFALDPSGARVQMDTVTAGHLTSRRKFISKFYEQVESGARVQKIHYLSAGENIFGVYTIDQPAISKGGSQDLSNKSLHYFHRDHLGSIQTVTNEMGGIVEILSFDSWGQRRDSNTWKSIDYHLKTSTDRGFTGHEHLDAVNLIHMNGRVYDPVIGRFISPDSMIQAPENTQSINRYSYVLNNPLTLTDPTGHFFRGLFKSIGKILGQLGRIAVVAAVTFYTGGILTGVLGGLGPVLGIGLSGIGAGIASTVTSALLQGGTIGDGLRSGIHGAPVNAFSAILTNQVGDLFFEGNQVKRPGAFAHSFGDFNNGAKAFAHGVSHGIISAASGGKFGQGFTAGSVSSLAGRLGDFGPVVGGATAAALTGGKIAEGAMTGTVIYLYNEQLHQNEQSLLSKATALRDAGMKFIDDFRAGAPQYENELRTLGYGSAAVGIVGGLTFAVVGAPIIGTVVVVSEAVDLALIGTAALRGQFDNTAMGLTFFGVGGGVSRALGAAEGSALKAASGATVNMSLMPFAITKDAYDYHKDKAR